MPRALTEKDVPVLDTVLAALMETFSPVRHPAAPGPAYS